MNEYSRKRPPDDELRGHLRTSWFVVIRWALLILAIAVAIGFFVRELRGETPTEWWRIVTAIEQQQDRLDDDEKRFIRNVINRLTLHEDAVPTPEHARWLRNIKARLDRR